MYENLTPYEKALATFGDRAALIAGLEISDKLSPENAFQEIKRMYKELKTLRKTERQDWDTADLSDV
ncbi:MAG: hypothetical protein EB127_22620 [Alphaproteobacteria bacterium]|jgi:hypothetical protein|nr:hypothetical protein [Alphaproteobacteria bacterium]